jgi:hypothetical protein
VSAAAWSGPPLRLKGPRVSWFRPPVRVLFRRSTPGVASPFLIRAAPAPCAQPERAFQPIAARFVRPVDPTDGAGNRRLREEDGMAGQVTSI